MEACFGGQWAFGEGGAEVLWGQGCDAALSLYNAESGTKSFQEHCCWQGKAQPEANEAFCCAGGANFPNVWELVLLSMVLIQAK